MPLHLFPNDAPDEGRSTPIYRPSPLWPERAQAPTEPARRPASPRRGGAPGDEKRLVAATDGSALGNPGPGGWAWYVTPERWSAGGVSHTTNNIMELVAVRELLRATGTTTPLTIRSDSQYVIQALTEWIHGWRKRGWKTAAGKAVANQEIIRALDADMAGRDVRFVWVKGHAGDQMNEQADRRARGAAEATKGGRVPLTGPECT